MMVVGKHLNTVPELMPRNLRKKDTWYNAKGLFMNPEKTEVVPFTRRKKTNKVVRLEYEFQEIFRRFWKKLLKNGKF